MNRFLAVLPLLLLNSLAFAVEEGEVPMETVGIGGIVAFFVICAAMTWAFVWYTNKSSKMTDEEKSGIKPK